MATFPPLSDSVLTATRQVEVWQQLAACTAVESDSLVADRLATLAGDLTVTTAMVGAYADGVADILAFLLTNEPSPRLSSLLDLEV